MLGISEINRAICFGNQWTNDDLNSIVDAIKFARSRITKQNIRSLYVGDQVQFTSSKTGRTMKGSVTKIAQKFVTVRTTDNGLWKVPANMLSMLESEVVV